MEFIKPGTTINFVGVRRIAFIASAVLILGSILSLWVRGGPNYGIDFTGGSLIQFKFHKDVKAADLRSALEGLGYGQTAVQEFGHKEENEFLVRIEKIDVDLQELQLHIEEGLKEKFGPDSLEVRRAELVGPKVGAELRRKGLMAVVYAIFGILIYVSWRFEFRFGMGSIIALVHDALITLGAFSILNKEIDLPIVAAILTIIGYSINDTIVVFDRIRENMRRIRRQNLETVLNSSINETLSRTLLTSLTTLIVVVALFLWGGAVIHDFAFALIVGILVGTYSSIYIATPTLIFWEEATAKRAAKQK